MANTLNLGNGDWATKENSLLGYNSESGKYKPLPFDFTRASNGTFVNKSGLIETAANGVPRIDFLGNTKGAMLLEPQRSNIWTNSNLSTSISLDGLTRTLNQGVSPSGDNDAALFNETATTGTHRFYRLDVPSTSTDFSMSFFAKKNGINIIRIVAQGGTKFADFNLSLGIVNAESGVNSSVIEDYGNGWYRCVINVTAAGWVGLYALNDSSQDSYLGNVSKGVYLYGAQLEQGSYATSLINTQGSAVTRVQDSCSQTVPDGVIGQTEGTVLIDFSFDGDISGNRSVAVLSSGGSADFVASFIFNNLFYARIRANNGSLVDVTKSNLTSGNHKIAIAYASNDLTFYLDGNIVGQNTSASVSFGSELSTIKIGESTSGTAELGGLVSKTSLYNTRLSNSELAALTTI